MGNRNNRKRAQPAATKPIGPAGWIIHQVFRPRWLLLAAIVVSSLVVGPRLARFLPDLSRRDEYQLRIENIHITRLPRWVPADLVEQVAERAGFGAEASPLGTAGNPSLLDDGLAERIAQAFRLHPWVAEVRRVQIQFPAKVDVALRYRRPVAMVEVKQGLFPVDADGVLLPPADFSVSQARRYPLIRNVHSTPQGPAGTNWGDIVVNAGARLTAVLTPYWKKFRLAAVRVPNRQRANTTIDDLVLVLITQRGSRIIWGRVPGSKHPGELSTERKIGRLEKYLTDFGDFDRPHGPYEIDIRHWQEISRRPLTAARNRSRR